MGRFVDAAFAPVDASSVAAFRVLFGLLMTVAVTRFFAHGWIAKYFLVPRHFFHYYGFEWVRPWAGAGMYVHFAVMGVLALAIAIGFFPRVSVALFGLAFAYAHLIDKTNYLNHYYLIICLCLLMSFLPLPGKGHDKRRGKGTIPAWALWALRAQFGIVYVFGGIAKLRRDWLVDAQPLTIWLGANADFPVLGRFFDELWIARVFSVAGAVFDLSIVGFLLWRRARPYALVALVVFHLLTAGLLQLGLFPYVMIAGSTLFLSADWPRAAWIPLVAMFRQRPAAPMPRVVPVIALSASRLRRALVLSGLAVYFTFHLLTPLRHIAYPGNLLWTEEGFRFSWHVMVMEKNGSADFRVGEPFTGRRYAVAPSEWFTPDQVKMMASQPDMILEAAHVIAADFRTRGVRDPEVRVDAFASLNGRSRARLVDPDVDLARVRDGFTAKDWILPFDADRSRGSHWVTDDGGQTP